MIDVVANITGSSKTNSGLPIKKKLPAWFQRGFVFRQCLINNSDLKSINSDNLVKDYRCNGWNQAKKRVRAILTATCRTSIGTTASSKSIGTIPIIAMTTCVLVEKFLSKEAPCYLELLQMEYAILSILSSHQSFWKFLGDPILSICIFSL